MSTSKFGDKRRYLRYEVLDYAMVQPELGESVQAVIVDIGLGGLQIRSKVSMDVGSACILHIGRLDGEPLVIAGEVRHSSAIPDSELFATGIRFAPRGHEDRVRIAEYVHGVFQRQCDKLLV